MLWNYLPRGMELLRVTGTESVRENALSLGNIARFIDLKISSRSVYFRVRA